MGDIFSLIWNLYNPDVSWSSLSLAISIKMARISHCMHQELWKRSSEVCRHLLPIALGFVFQLLLEWFTENISFLCMLIIAYHVNTIIKLNSIHIKMSDTLLTTERKQIWMTATELTYTQHFNRRIISSQVAHSYN